LEAKMLIESLGNVTFVNGILRVQCNSVDTDGKIKESGVIQIPAGSLNDVLNGLINSSKSIEKKLNSIEDGSNSEKKEKAKNKGKNKK
jgi:hypothetical protein|tara:strand:- start:3526 stop:3789 length:264 start_codon:yes stop_codon:yes gene_type:complete